MTQTMRLAALVAIAASPVLTGCASIVGGTNQVISVEAKHKGQPVVGASCKLDNGKGTYYVTTPGTVSVHRAYDDMKIQCEKDSMEPGLATVKSITKPLAFGNILFGGVIGAAVDVGSGAAYDYPVLISVIMGEATRIVTDTAAANSLAGASASTSTSTKKIPFKRPVPAETAGTSTP